MRAQAEFPGGIAQASVDLSDLNRYAPGSRYGYGVVTLHAIQFEHTPPKVQITSIQVFNAKGKLVDATGNPAGHGGGGSQANERFSGARLPIDKLARGEKYTVVVNARVNSTELSLRARPT